MPQITKIDAIKIKLSEGDQIRLRRLIVDEIYFYRQTMLGSEELINRITESAMEFIESCLIEIE